MKRMLMVNLHEIDFLEETLTLLARYKVTDCVVHEVEGVASHHTGKGLEPVVLGSIASLFKQDRNVNYLIHAVADEEMVGPISAGLKGLQKEDRYASSFWFVPIEGYCYHKDRP